MSFDTPEGRRDEYLDSCRRVGGRTPDDEEIAAITGYVSPQLRIRRVLENSFLIVFAVVITAALLIWIIYS